MTEATRKGLSKRGLVSIALATLLVVAAAFVFARSGPELEYNPNVLRAQLQLLRFDDGLIAPPPAPGSPSLEATAWALKVASATKTMGPKLDQIAVQSLYEQGTQGVWDNFYLRSIQRTTGPWPMSGTAGSTPQWVSNEADLSELAPGADISSQVLELWAWVNAPDQDTQRLVPEGTANSVVELLAQCRGNNFVQLHLLEIAVQLGPQQGQIAGELLSDCPRDLIAHEPPRTEEALLALVGVAGANSATDDWSESPVSQKQVREWLAPQEFMSTDAWWAYHALRGYTAADGDTEVFKSVAQSLLERADQDGIVPAASHPVSSLQDVYFAVKVMNLIAIDPFTVLKARSVLAMGSSPIANAWGDADLAMWGSTLYSLGLAPSQSDSELIRQAASTCASERVVPANARYVGACRQAQYHFGGSTPELDIDWNDWQGAPAEILLASVYALGEPLPASSAQSTVDALLGDLDALQTSSLAQLLTVAHDSGVDLDAGEANAVWTEISSRRASEPFTELFVRHGSVRQPDFYSTFAVLEATNESRGF